MKAKFLALAFGLALSAPQAFAQNYPTRAITVVVPYAAGGNTDVVGRIVAELKKVSGWEGPLDAKRRDSLQGQLLIAVKNKAELGNGLGIRQTYHPS